MTTADGDTICLGLTLIRLREQLDRIEGKLDVLGMNRKDTRELSMEELAEKVKVDYPMDKSEGSLVDRYIAREMHRPVEEIVNSPFQRTYAVDWTFWRYFMGEGPHPNTGRYIKDVPSDLEWLKKELSKEE